MHWSGLNTASVGTGSTGGLIAVSCRLENPKHHGRFKKASISSIVYPGTDNTNTNVSCKISLNAIQCLYAAYGMLQAAITADDKVTSVSASGPWGGAHDAMHLAPSSHSLEPVYVTRKLAALCIVNGRSC